MNQKFPHPLKKYDDKDAEFKETCSHEIKMNINDVRHLVYTNAYYLLNTN